MLAASHPPPPEGGGLQAGCTLMQSHVQPFDKIMTTRRTPVSMAKFNSAPRKLGGGLATLPSPSTCTYTCIYRFYLARCKVEGPGELGASYIPSPVGERGRFPEAALFASQARASGPHLGSKENRETERKLIVFFAVPFGSRSYWRSVFSGPPPDRRPHRRTGIPGCKFLMTAGSGKV